MEIMYHYYLKTIYTKVVNGYHYIQKQVTESIYPWLRGSFVNLLHYIAFKLDPFWIHLSYFLIFPFIGYLALKSLMQSSSSPPDDFDIFFTSMSTMTESSLSSVEMEVFSTQQLGVLIVLMFCGGEVFTSMIGLFLRRFKFSMLGGTLKDSSSSCDNDDVVITAQVIELRTSSTTTTTVTNPNSTDDADDYIIVELPKDHHQVRLSPSVPHPINTLKHESVKSLSRLLFGYLTATHIISYLLISIYISSSHTTTSFLKSKSLSIQTFSMFLTVSTLSNCGFLPNNENMVPFKKNSGLQLILLPQIFLGNSLHPCCLRLLIWILHRISKRDDYSYMLNHHDEMGYAHLMSGFNSKMLALTSIGFVVLQFVMICVVEWWSDEVMDMSWIQKVVGVLFQAANTRHSGESIFDLSRFSPAVLVLIVVMMYLPPYIMFIPRKKSIITEEDKRNSNNKDGMRKLQPTRSVILEKYLIFSPLSFLVIFIIIICITERNSFNQDPLNFNVFTVVFEVISAYGNVGYSMGYSCKKRLNFDHNCEDAAYGFAGRWSKPGKFILILVMLFGRLKRFSMHGGRAWHLR